MLYFTYTHSEGNRRELRLKMTTTPAFAGRPVPGRPALMASKGQTTEARASETRLAQQGRTSLGSVLAPALRFAQNQKLAEQKAAN